MSSRTALQGIKACFLAFRRAAGLGVRTAYITVSAIHHLQRARTLAQSLTQAIPTADLIVFLGDKKIASVLSATPDLRIIPIEDMGISDLGGMTFRYSSYELNTALKPFAFDYVFDKLGYDRAILLDSDIFVLRDFTHAHRALDLGASCIMTPHITEPIRSEYEHPNDRDIIKTGSLNTGFVAFSRVPEARRFIDWWREQVRTDCTEAFDRGIFFDQLYAQLAPAFMEGFRTLRHAGYNVAYWNLMHRPVTQRKGQFWTKGVPIHFVHFSGVQPSHPELFSKYQTQYRRGQLNGLEPLYERYLALLEKNDQFAGGRYSAVPYQFGEGQLG